MIEPFSGSPRRRILKTLFWLANAAFALALLWFALR